MNINVVEAMVDQIELLAKDGDHEAAHIAEDELYIKVLEAIASGYKNPDGLAIAALEAKDIEFDRWCA